MLSRAIVLVTILSASTIAFAAAKVKIMNPDWGLLVSPKFKMDGNGSISNPYDYRYKLTFTSNESIISNNISISYDMDLYEEIFFANGKMAKSKLKTLYNVIVKKISQVIPESILLNAAEAKSHTIGESGLVYPFIPFCKLKNSYAQSENFIKIADKNDPIVFENTLITRYADRNAGVMILALSGHNEDLNLNIDCYAPTRDLIKLDQVSGILRKIFGKKAGITLVNQS